MAPTSLQQNPSFTLFAQLTSPHHRAELQSPPPLEKLKLRPHWSLAAARVRQTGLHWPQMDLSQNTEGEDVFVPFRILDSNRCTCCRRLFSDSYLSLVGPGTMDIAESSFPTLQHTFYESCARSRSCPVHKSDATKVKLNTGNFGVNPDFLPVNWRAFHKLLPAEVAH